MSGTSAPRIGCCVPGCRRTFRADTCEPGVRYICGRCFKLADLPFRRRHKQLTARWRTLNRLTRRKAVAAIIAKAEAAGRVRLIPYGLLHKRMRSAMDRAWSAIVHDAEIKLAMGAPGAPRQRRAA